MARTLHTDAVLIDKIGSATMREKFGLTYQALHNWRVRGIPGDHRPTFSKLARRHGVTLPKDFLAPRSVRATNDISLITMRSTNAPA